VCSVLAGALNRAFAVQVIRGVRSPRCTPRYPPVFYSRNPFVGCRVLPVALNRAFPVQMVRGVQHQIFPAALRDIRVQFIHEILCVVRCVLAVALKRASPVQMVRGVRSPSIFAYSLFAKYFCGALCTGGRPKPCASGTDGSRCSTRSSRRCTR